MRLSFSFNYGEKSFTEQNLENGKIILENGVSVTPKVKEIGEFDAIYWYLEFENVSGKDSQIFSSIKDCDINLPFNEAAPPATGYMPTKENLYLSYMNGMVNWKLYKSNDKGSSVEYSLSEEYLKLDTTFTVKTSVGRSCDGYAPYFDLHAIGGTILAIGWTGSWIADFTKSENYVNVKTGLANARFYLKDGEKIRTSSILLMKYEKDEDKFNKYRRLISTHFSHKTKKPHLKDGLMACELWGGLPSEEMIKRINEFNEHGINFEEYWIDAGWYGKSTKCDTAFQWDWWEYTGDWTVNERLHPNGLRDVRDAAKKAGAKLMLWFEVERAITTTPVYNNHPDWFIDNNYPDEKNRIVYYGNKDALEYTKKLIGDYIEKLDLGCYRQDFNVHLDKFFENTDEENRIGITEIKHIMGVYELYDFINENYPDILIDNCSSGGRRNDIEMNMRSIPFFRSDYLCQFNANGDVYQCHNVSISKFMPFNGCTTKSDLDIYDIRSSYSSSWGAAYYNAIFQSMNEEKFKMAKYLFDEYVGIRKYFSKDFYNYGAEVFDDTSWAIYNYHDEEADEGVVLAFRRENSPFATAEIQINHLKGDYNFTNLDTKETFKNDKNLKLEIPTKRSSLILTYKK